MEQGVWRMTRTKYVITYHGRSGHPQIHTAKSGKKYIMVRASGGGVKRLYAGSKYWTGKEEKRLKL
jgi:hypothetical protein